MSTWRSVKLASSRLSSPLFARLQPQAAAAVPAPAPATTRASAALAVAASTRAAVPKPTTSHAPPVANSW